MRFSRLAFAPLLFTSAFLFAAPRTHTVALGGVKRVPYVAADVARENKSDEAGTLRVRPLVVDGRIREWTTGDTHEITDRTFVVRRVLHINDTLPGERTARWVWQPGPWLLVDRTSGRITALHLPDFDPAVSDVVWYRDYAAYCGIKTTIRNGGIAAVVWQIASRRPALEKVIGRWPQAERIRPVCVAPIWQREPMRITMQVSGGQPITFDVVGTSTNLVEDGESPEDDE
ncbi:MAG: hypothetical protein JSS87_02115 [Acidobacteria bacterium]|nr:hypothetical protein [Acidobacteriota bacterium]